MVAKAQSRNHCNFDDLNTYALLLRPCDEVDLCTLKLITIALKKQ